MHSLSAVEFVHVTVLRSFESRDREEPEDGNSSCKKYWEIPTSPCLCNLT